MVEPSSAGMREGKDSTLVSFVPEHRVDWTGSGVYSRRTATHCLRWGETSTLVSWGSKLEIQLGSELLGRGRPKRRLFQNGKRPRRRER